MTGTGFSSEEISEADTSQTRREYEDSHKVIMAAAVSCP